MAIYLSLILLCIDGAFGRTSSGSAEIRITIPPRYSVVSMEKSSPVIEANFEFEKRYIDGVLILVPSTL